MIANMPNQNIATRVRRYDIPSPTTPRMDMRIPRASIQPHRIPWPASLPFEIETDGFVMKLPPPIRIGCRRDCDSSPWFPSEILSAIRLYHQLSNYDACFLRARSTYTAGALADRVLVETSFMRSGT